MAAGKGTRLEPMTSTRPKPLIPIGGKPLIQHTVETLRDNGVSEILLIVGYLKEKIMQYFGNGEWLGVKLEYIEQKEFLGTGHAANLARDFTADDNFLLIYGDLLLDPRIISEIISSFNEAGGEYDGIIAALRVDDPTKYGILETDEDGNLVKIHEKPPDDRYGNLANAGIYLFTPYIFKGIDKTELSPRGEYELTDSIENIIKDGKKVHVVDIARFYWSDVGHPWQLLDAHKHILGELDEKLLDKARIEEFIEKIADKPSVQYSIGNNYRLIDLGADVEDGVHLDGLVILGKGVEVKSGTYIEGPVIIGESSVIGPNAYIRPYTYIGKNCRIGNSSEIKNSIIMDRSNVPHLSYVGDSVVGENVNLGCGTVFANVRLDKKEISMNIKGIKKRTGHRKLGAFVGDNVSFGINVNVMPGKKIGPNSQIGSNTVISEDIPPNTLVFVKQQIVQKKIDG